MKTLTNICRGTQENLCRILGRSRAVLLSQEGSITEWLIVLLITVVVGAVFMVLYQDSITSVWNSVIAKIMDVFSL